MRSEVRRQRYLRCHRVRMHPHRAMVSYLCFGTMLSLFSFMNWNTVAHLQRLFCRPKEFHSNELILLGIQIFRDKPKASCSWRRRIKLCIKVNCHKARFCLHENQVVRHGDRDALKLKTEDLPDRPFDSLNHSCSKPLTSAQGPWQADQSLRRPRSLRRSGGYPSG